MSDLPEKFKIMVPDKFSEEITKKLYSLGIYCISGETNLPAYINPIYIIVQNNIFRCASEEGLTKSLSYHVKIDDFLRLDMPEITLTQLMNAKPQVTSKKCIMDLGDSLISLYKSIKKLEDGFENIFYK